MLRPHTREVFRTCRLSKRFDSVRRVILIDLGLHRRSGLLVSAMVVDRLWMTAMGSPQGVILTTQPPSVIRCGVTSHESFGPPRF